MSNVALLDGVFIDPRLQQVANLVKPDIPLPTITKPRDSVGPTRLRELEGLGALPFFTSTLINAIGADVAPNQLQALAQSGAVSEIWYDAPNYALEAPPTQPSPDDIPIYALADDPPPTRASPFRTSPEDLRERLAVRQALAKDEPNSIFAWTGFQGPEELQEDRTLLKTVSDQRDFLRATTVTEEMGLDGTGATVAVLDTGIDDTHPMLDGQVDQAHSTVPEPAGIDNGGHGTWCASCIAGQPFEITDVPGMEGQVAQGIAPGARLIDIKVLTGEGSGALSDLILGIEIALQEGADILNLSLGSPFATPRIDPAEQAVNDAMNQGVIPVVASGNSWGWGTVGSPGTAKNALTVGSVAMESPSPDSVSTFSSKGPTSRGRVEPDLAGPGGQAGAAREGPLNEVILGAAAGFTRGVTEQSMAPMRGTSMATPAIAGVLAQFIPIGLPRDRDDLFALLSTSTRSGALLPIKNNRTGWGTLDAARLLERINNPPGPSIRRFVQGQLDAVRPLLGQASHQVANLQPLPVGRPDQARLSLV